MGSVIALIVKMLSLWITTEPSFLNLPPLYWLAILFFGKLIMSMTLSFFLSIIIIYY